MNGVVMKFGGTSVADAESLERSCQIVADHPDVEWVVVSASAKTTNQLEELASKSLHAIDEALILWESIWKRHAQSAEQLNLPSWTLDKLKDLFFEGEGLIKRLHQEGELKPSMMASIYALGERMNTPLFAGLLTLKGQNKEGKFEVNEWDARELMFTDDQFLNAHPLSESLFEAVQRLPINKEEGLRKIFVTQGFIGSTVDGKTTVLGREGSDYSAALFAQALRARELWIWSDVEGVLSSDPRMIQSPQSIEQMDYFEGEYLSQAGAKVIHPKTYGPLRDLAIPLFVASSFLGKNSKKTLISHLQETLTPRCIALVDARESFSLIGFQINQIFDSKLKEKLNQLPFAVHVIERADHRIQLSASHPVEGLEDVERKEVLRAVHEAIFST